MKKIFLILMSVLLITGCNSNTDTNSEYGDGVNFEETMTSDQYVVIDVRTPEEYKEGHVVGSINIPYDEIDSSIDIDKDKLILVYCKSGRRSAIAATTLTDLGYEVIDLGAFEKLDMEKE